MNVLVFAGGFIVGVGTLGLAILIADAHRRRHYERTHRPVGRHPAIGSNVRRLPVPTRPYDWEAK